MFSYEDSRFCALFSIWRQMAESQLGIFICKRIKAPLETLIFQGFFAFLEKKRKNSLFGTILAFI